jgi:YfiH family protein
MDAFITKEKNVALSVFVADCLPIFIFDKVKNIIAVVHAGWKGTKASIAKKTIFVMQQAFESEPKDLVALLGPSIRRCCYGVGEEFKEYFKRGIYQKKDKLYLDVVEINYLQLKEVGILDSNIFDAGICTCCQNDKFFSFRKEKDSCGRPANASMAGRQMALIAMK